MIDIFYLKLFSAFLMGAIWVTSATMIAERFGSRIGGVITGIPSVALISFLFIALVQSPQIASQATTVVPIVMGFNSLLIAIYVLLGQRYNFSLSVIAALIVWFVLSLGLVFIQFDNLALSFLIFILLLIGTYYVIERYGNVHATGQKKVKRTFGQLFFRAVLSGSIVAFAVYISKLGGPVLGGVFASFPGIVLSTIIVTYLAHGKEFSFAVMKTLMFSGPVNVVIYAMCIRFLYPVFDVVLGTLVSFIISVITSYITYRFLNRHN